MLSYVINITHKISLIHINSLFLIGLAIFGGTLGGKFFQRIKIPQVVGYIVIGIIIGQSGLKLISNETISSFQHFNNFALGLIGFMIGGELQFGVFKKYGKQFIYILFFEALGSFIFTSSIIFVFCIIFLNNIILSIIFSLILGSISSATAAAGTTDVLWEYKTKGPLTTTLLGIVALDDILALFLFAISASIAGNLFGSTEGNLGSEVFQLFYEIGFAVIIGSASGYILAKLLKKYREEDKILIFSIGGILLTLGLSLLIHVDMILSAMVMGIVLSNIAPRLSKDVFKILEKFAPPLYILFFVLVGAKLNLGKMNFFLGALAFLYLIGRTAGKMIGAGLGGSISKAVISVKKYLPLCLFSQSGVAIGLSIIASNKFNEEIGNTIIIVITTTTFIVQILGPLFIKIAVKNAGEVGLNVTEEDIVKSNKVKEILKGKSPIVTEMMQTDELIKFFSESDYFNYPVADKNSKLVGIISIEHLKNILNKNELSGFLLAHDIMEPVITNCSPEILISEAQDLMKHYNLDYLPVVENNKAVGLIENRNIRRYISFKLLELQQRVDKLD